MAAATGMDDDESWLYGETNQDEKKEEIEEIDEPMIEDTETVTNIDETSRLSRFSNDSETGAESQDKSHRDDSIREYDDKEAGELSGEEESTAAHGTSTPETGERDGDGEGGEEGDGDGDGDGERRSDESDSDDDSVQVTIGDIKAAPSYGYAGPPVNLNIKRGGAYQQGGPGGQSSKTKGVDLDSVGMINGVPTYEFNLDTMEDKPWRKPGADITDYFNYGFNEDTWKAYCEKQRKLRLEAAGGSSAGSVATKPHHTGKDQQIPVATVNENSKYAGGLMKKAGPPPGRKTSGSIDVIGASTTTSRRPLTQSPKENVIQVMTADKREYSRKPNAPPFDTSMPPPPPGMMPPIGLGVFPPDLAMPPPGLPPGFPPPGLPPPNIPLPPPNYGDSYDGYNRNYPPPPGSGPPDRLPPGFDNSYEGSYYNGGANSGNNAGSSQDAYNPFEPTGDGPWDGRDNPGSRYSQSRSPTNEDEFERRHREFRDRSRDRDRERERDRDRDRDRERDRDRDRHRERDRDRERERDREYDSEDRRDPERRHREHRDREEKHSRSSRRKHRDEDDSSDHRSSRHKRKRSKRDKDEESVLGVEQQDAMPEVNEEESQQE